MRVQSVHSSQARRRRFGRGLGASVLGAGLLFGALPLLAGAAPATDRNPDLPSVCGLDVTLVLDDSGSIDSAEAGLVRAAADRFATALVGTPSRLKVVTFANRATGVTASGAATSNTADIVFRNPSSYTAPTSGAGSGGTNWDDGLEVARRSNGGPGELVVFVTDGDPTYRNEDEPDGHANNGSHDLDGDGSSVSGNNLSAAVYEADAIKASGAHLFGIGIGLGASSSEQRLNDVTGDEELTLGAGGVPNISFGTADYTIAPNFDDLEGVIRAFVRDLCAPSVNVTKFLQSAAGTTAKAGAGNPWTFSAAVSPTPSSWQSPTGASGATASQATDDLGGASFKWKMSTNNATVDLTEVAKPGWVYNGARCTRNLLDGADPIVVFNTVGTNAPGQSGDPSELLDLSVGLNQAMNCEVYNRQLRPATIQVAKQTVPAGLGDTFDFTLAQGGPALDTIDDLGHGATGTFTPVPAGTYDVTEAAAPGYTTTSATCDDLATTPTETAAPSRLAVAEGQSWRCTFVNTAKPGTVTVVKTAVGADGTFGFTSDVPGLSAFSLTTVGGTKSSTTVSAPVGTYHLAETAAAPWVLSGASCTGGDGPAAFRVDPGEDVVCTFTNTAPAPTITVAKAATTPSVTEPGGPVTYLVTVTNTSVEPVTITDLTDAVDGGADFDITTVAGPVTATSCDELLDQELAATGTGSSASCSFTATVTGNGGDDVVDVVTVNAVDAQGDEATDDDDATVAVTDVAPALSITKTPSVSSLAEPGGPVSYTVSVTNTGAEPMTIDTLTDVVEGGAPIDVTTVGAPVSSTTCGALVDQVLTTSGPGATRTCSFTLDHVVDRSDLADHDLDDVVTITAHDDDGTISVPAAAEVPVTDTKPTISVTKTASATSVAETAPGSTTPVTYVVTIQNTSVEAVKIDSIADAVEGGAAVPADGTCAELVGTTLAPQTGTTCSFTLGVAGNAGDEVDDVVTVTASDDDGNTTTGSDDATVTLSGLDSSLAVTKSAAPGSVPEPGAPVTFTITIKNTSVADTVTIGSVVDAVDGAASVPAGGSCPALTGIELAPGEQKECTFVLDVEGDAGAIVSDTVTVTGTDDDSDPVSQSADEDVAITDVLASLTLSKTASVASVPEPGGPVTFTLIIDNTSAADSITLDAITDAVGTGADAPAGGNCPALVGTTLAPGTGTTCSFTLPVTGNAGDAVSDTATVTGTDDDQAKVSETASAIVDVTDVDATLAVDKTASTGSVAEPGGPVTFTVDIENTSPSDAVTLDAITDSVDGGAAEEAGGTCPDLIGTVLEPEDDISCTFTLAVNGDAGDAVTDTVTVTGTDDDDDPVTASGSEIVDVTDVAPTGTVAKVAGANEVPEPGGPVTFTVTAKNTSPDEDVTVTSLTDLVDGEPVDITLEVAPVTATDCAVGTVLAPNETYSCAFTLDVSGRNAGDVVVDAVTVGLADNDGNTVSPTDTEAVAVTDVLPTISVVKQGGTVSVAAPGAAVDFDVTVTNLSLAEPVTLTELTDTIEGGPGPFSVMTVGGQVLATSCEAGRVIAAGASYECSFRVMVAADEASQVTDVVDAVAIDDEDNEATAGDDAVTAVDARADLSITKRLVGELRAGEQGTYEVEVTNAGPSTAVDVEVIDTLPDGLVLGSAEGAGWACTSGTGTTTCERPTLAPGETATIEVVVFAELSAAGDDLTNVVDVEAATTDPDLANNHAEATDVVEAVDDAVVDNPPTTAGPPAVAEAGDDRGPQATGGDPLPRTGIEPGPVVAVGLCLLAAGLVVLAVRRRRAVGGV